MINDCLLTRHHNGFVREEHFKKLLSKRTDYAWFLPFIIMLIGEYVIEILQVIKEHLADMNNGRFKQFISDNPKFIEVIESRVISYWNCYYRQTYPNIIDYVGYELLDYLRFVRKE